MIKQQDEIDNFMVNNTIEIENDSVDNNNNNLSDLSGKMKNIFDSFYNNNNNNIVTVDSQQKETINNFSDFEEDSISP